MKTGIEATKKSSEAFVVKALNKEMLKASSFESARTSFAIEGIHFTDAEFSILKSKIHLKK